MRSASRLALVSSSLVALPLVALTPTSALAVEAEVGGKPLVVDVTNTSILNYHFDNRNSEIVDDNYGEWLDRLNVQASWWKLRLGVRIDGSTFFSTLTPEEIRSAATVANPGTTAKALKDRLDYENVLYRDLHTRYLRAFYPSKLFVGFIQPGIDVTVGDFYAQLGRGLVFSARKIDEVAVDTTVRGVKVVGDHDFGSFRLAGTLFAGQMNPIRVDEISGRRLHGAGSPLFFGFPSAGPLTIFGYEGTKPVPEVEPAAPSYLEDTVFGGHVEGGTKLFLLGGNTSVLSRKAGAVGNNDPTKSHDLTVTYSGSLSLPSLAKHGDLYVEVAGQNLRDGHLLPSTAGSPGGHEPDASGHAVYASASINAGPVAISLEGKHYRDFFPLTGNTSAAEYNTSVVYNQVPTVEPIYTEPVSGGAPNVCIDGGRGRVDYRFNRGASVYFWLGRSASWTERSGQAEASCTIDDRHKNSTWDSAVGTELSLEQGTSHIRAWVGGRASDLPIADLTGTLPEPTTTFYREGYIRYDLVKHLSGRFSLQMQGFHRRRYEPFSFQAAWTEGENYTALQWSPHLSVVFGYEYKAQAGCRPAIVDAEGSHPSSDLCHYFNGGVTWRAGVGEEGTAAEKILGRLFDTVNIFVGQRRGALRCVSGVCRQFPPFEGAKLEITSRF